MCCAACAAGQKNSPAVAAQTKNFHRGAEIHLCSAVDAVRKILSGRKISFCQFRIFNDQQTFWCHGARGGGLPWEVANVAGRGAPMASWRTLQMLLPRTRCITRNVWHSQFQTTENCFVVVVPRENNFPVTLTKNMVMNKEPQKIDSNFQFRLGWHKC